MDPSPLPAPATTREWTLRRNCSLSPRQVARAYAVLCAGSLAVAVGFLAHGVWLVLAFSLVELALVGLALLLYARHATDHERIALSESGLLVTCVRPTGASSCGSIRCGHACCRPTRAGAH